jgi:hypothetical protein
MGTIMFRAVSCCPVCIDSRKRPIYCSIYPSYIICSYKNIYIEVIGKWEHLCAW